MSIVDHIYSRGRVWVEKKNIGAVPPAQLLLPHMLLQQQRDQKVTVQLHVRKISLYPHEDDRSTLFFSEKHHPTAVKSFWVSRSALLSDDTARRAVSSILSYVRIHADRREPLLQQFCSLARLLRGEDGNGASIVVEIEFRKISLKKARVVDGSEYGSMEQCMICLEEFSAGVEVIFLDRPCSHVYHEDCILKWLGTSDLCPLCRFSLPS